MTKDESLYTPLDRKLDEYEDLHCHPTNVMLHALGIPLIVTAFGGLIAAIDPAVPGPLRLIAVLGTSAWYWKQGSSSCGIIMGVVYTGAVFLGALLPPLALGGLGLTGAVALGIGHKKYEKKSPAFFTNLTHLLVGPLHLVILAWEKLHGERGASI